MDTRRTIPPVSEMLQECMNQPWSRQFSREQILDAIRAGLAEIRLLLKETSSPLPDMHDVLRRIQAIANSESTYSLKRVINATGVLVHTNLGRAPLSRKAVEHIEEISGYSNLELDLNTGLRGSRDEHLERVLRKLLGVEGSLVVNNNAAALLLILNGLAEGKEVIVSRGELIEIGGSFRLPEIMKKSGAILREVGTTNKTHLSDYRKAINDHTAMILLAHPSNFQVIGFTEKPELKDLVELGKEKNIPVVEDHGSGILVPLEDYGISGEPSVQERLQEGLDLICFSGDKILGGSQAGIICGKKNPVETLRRNPLFRALRVDKMAYAALEATLFLYAQGKQEQIPVIRMISISQDELKRRAGDWIRRLIEVLPEETFEIVETSNYVGGGVAPMKQIPSCAVSISSLKMTAQEMAGKLRECNPPIFSRIESDELLLELRTITEEEQTGITNSLVTICSAPFE